MNVKLRDPLGVIIPFHFIVIDYTMNPNDKFIMLQWNAAALKDTLFFIKDAYPQSEALKQLLNNSENNNLAVAKISTHNEIERTYSHIQENVLMRRQPGDPFHINTAQTLF